MESLFLHLTRMSFSAGWMLLAVILARPFLRKAPRTLICLLWGLAALRLILPVSIQSRMSLVPTEIPMQDKLSLAAPTVIQIPVQAAGAVQQASPSPAVIMAWIWCCGMALMVLYALVSYLRLKRRVTVSMRLRENIFLCDSIPSPFILGVIRPRIYLPSALTAEQSGFVLAHEQAHLSRGDHFWKPLGYLLLCIYWFHPLCWIGYILFCRDIEMACDEHVVKTMAKQERSAYSHTLLECSIRSRKISACPLAFGEAGVKARVRNVLNYRKPTVWVVTLSCLLCVILASCFMTDPMQTENVDSPEKEDTTSAILLDVLPEEPDLKEATVGMAANAANIYSAPSRRTQIVNTLDLGDSVFIFHTEKVDNNVWYFVRPDADGTFGWVDASDIVQHIKADTAEGVTFTEADTGSICTVSTSVDVRTAPSLQGHPVSTLEAGSTITILKSEDIADTVWCYIRSEDKMILGWTEAEKLIIPAEAVAEE